MRQSASGSTESLCKKKRKRFNNIGVCVAVAWDKEARQAVVRAQTVEPECLSSNPSSPFINLTLTSCLTSVFSTVKGG